MRSLPIVAAAMGVAVVAASLGGCGTLKKFTGQRDDTVLPGQREEILPPEQTRRQDPNASDGANTQQPSNAADIPCDPTVQECPTNIDQEAGGFEG